MNINYVMFPLQCRTRADIPRRSSNGEGWLMNINEHAFSIVQFAIWRSESGRDDEQRQVQEQGGEIRWDKWGITGMWLK